MTFVIDLALKTNYLLQKFTTVTCYHYSKPHGDWTSLRAPLQTAVMNHRSLSATPFGAKSAVYVFSLQLFSLCPPPTHPSPNRSQPLSRLLFLSAVQILPQQISPGFPLQCQTSSKLKARFSMTFDPTRHKIELWPEIAGFGSRS